MSDYLHRINTLSDNARLFLAQQLQLTTTKQQLVAFLVANSSETIRDQQQNELVEATRLHVENHLPAHLHPDAYLVLDRIPTLSNGKADIAKLKTLTLPATGTSNSTRSKNQSSDDKAFSASTQKLINILEALLDFEGILPTDNFFELGGDSITAIRFVSKAREAGVDISVANVGKLSTIEQLAQSAHDNTLTSSSDNKTTSDETNSAFGEAPLTPIQRWFFAINHPFPAHWNSGGQYTIKSTQYSPEQIKSAIQSVLARHIGLTAQFHSKDGNWSCHYVDTAPGEQVCKVLNNDQSTQKRVSFDSFANDAQAQFKLDEGWLIRFGIQYEQNIEPTLYWVAHHLVIDALSIQRVINDIERTLESTEKSNDSIISATNPAPNNATGNATISVRDWAIRCSNVENSSLASPMEKASFESQLTPIATREYATQNQTITHTSTFNAGQCNALLSVAQTNSVPITSILIAALAYAWRQTFNDDSLPLDIEGHGRDLLGAQVDVSDTVGWFSTFYPANIHISDQEHRLHLVEKTDAQLKSQKETNQQFLLDPNSVNYTDAQMKGGRVLFNHFGTSNEDYNKKSLFHSQTINMDILRNANNYRSHNIELNSSIENNSLIIQWHIADLAVSTLQQSSLYTDFTGFLESLIADTESAATTSGTPSAQQFPDSGMEQNELDEFLKSLK